MKSLSKHILIALIWGSIILLTILDVFIWNQTKTYLIEGIKRNTHEKVILAKKILNDNAFINKDSEKLKSFADEIKKITELRVTLIDREGAVLADSDVELHKLDEVKNHIMRSEVQEALRTSTGFAIRHSATINRDLMYYCENIRDNGRVIGFIRFAIFSEDFSNQMNYTIFILVMSNILFLVIVFSLGYIYWKHVNRQFLTFEQSLEKIKNKQKFSSIPPQHYAEFDRLASLSNAIGENFQEVFRFVNNHEQDLTSIFNSLTEGVAAFDKNGKLTFVNQAFCKVLKVNVDEAKEKHYYDLVQFPPLIKDLSEFEEKKEPIKRRSKYYNHKYVEYNIVPLKSGEGVEKGLIITVEDVTQLQELETVRTDFVANVSHEFKTPLTSIKGYAETLQMGALNNPDMAKKFLTKIEHQTVHLENMVMDLLNLTRIEREDNLKLEEIDIKAAILDILEDFKPQTETHGQKLVINDSLRSEEVLVKGNQFLVQNIVSNFIINAIHYNSEKGTVTTALKLVDDNFRLEVSDTGIGISDSEKKRIFERFYRVEEAKNIYVEGSGLGLSIVKHSVEMLGGKFGVISEPGKGSTFWVEVPVK